MDGTAVAAAAAGAVHFAFDLEFWFSQIKLQCHFDSDFILSQSEQDGLVFCTLESVAVTARLLSFPSVVIIGRIEWNESMW